MKDTLRPTCTRKECERKDDFQDCAQGMSCRCACHGARISIPKATNDLPSRLRELAGHATNEPSMVVRHAADEIERLHGKTSMLQELLDRSLTAGEKCKAEIERLRNENEVLRTPTIACENCGSIAQYKFNGGPLGV